MSFILAVLLKAITSFFRCKSSLSKDNQILELIAYTYPVTTNVDFILSVEPNDNYTRNVRNNI